MKLFDFIWGDHPPKLLSPSAPATCGYAWEDTNIIARSLAAERKNVGYIDTIDLVKRNEDGYAAEQFMKAAQHNQRIIFGPIWNVPDYKPWDMLGSMAVLTKYFQEMENTPFSTAVIPFSVRYHSEEKIAHSMTLVIDHHKDKGKTDIIILEQHAKRDGSDKDYSKETQDVLNFLKSLYEASGYQVTAFINTEPTCIIPKVCGVAALEGCRKMLDAESPIEKAKIPEQLWMSEADIDNAHKRNIRRVMAEPNHQPTPETW